MESNLGTEAISSSIRHEHDETTLEPFQFNEKIQRLMTLPPENASSFTMLLDLPTTQAMELLHSSAPVSGELALHLIEEQKSYFHSFNGSNLIFPSNAVLIERAVKFSVLARVTHSMETSSVSSNSTMNSQKVKNEPAETDSSTNSLQPLVSDLTIVNINQKSMKRN